MHHVFAACIAALTLVSTAAAQEPTAPRARAAVDVPAPADRKGAAVPAALLPAGAPAIQFDAKGVDFNPWLRSFVSKVRRNWVPPSPTDGLQGSVKIAFVVNRDGTVTDVRLSKPSDVEALNTSARTALEGARLDALPAQYPDDSATFTVTFFHNVMPPGPAQGNPPAR